MQPARRDVEVESRMGAVAGAMLQRSGATPMWWTNLETSLNTFGGQSRQRMARDHQFLVCRNHVKRNTTLGRRYAQGMRRIGLRIQNRTQPSESGGNPRANSCRILTYAGSEHEGVEPAKCRRQHARMKRDPVAEIIERKGGARIGARLQLAHVVAVPERPFSPHSR
jgi:hypothetical protein